MVHFHCVLPMLAERFFFGHDFHFPAFTLLFSSPATMLWSYLSDPRLAGVDTLQVRHRTGSTEFLHQGFCKCGSPTLLPE